MTGVEAQLSQAYAICRGIARRSAKNFYYAFWVLRSEKRDALSAVYAFMRHADDIADSEVLAPVQKAAALAEWLGAAQEAFARRSTDDPVLLALADAQRRFQIPAQLFEQLIAGTAMDIASGGSQPTATYPTFDDLYRYCYHVASVVGLVCIRIFGYRDPAAEPLAVQCGVAFQLTNIIRDVKEDALLGRVYLPLEDLQRFGRSPAELDSAQLNNGFDPARFRAVLDYEAQRAREYYRSAEALLPLIDEDARPALWTLVEIYRRLLDKIVTAQYDVFHEKIRLSTAEKLSILGKGFLQRLA